MTETVDAGGESFETGEYLFCVVSLGDGPAEFETEGIDGRPARLVEADGVGAVVQRCESLFDSDDPDTVKEWLLDHQRTVDAAGEAFGTPLPFRFDTIVRGDEGAVREWLEEEHDALEEALAAVEGRWEYRVELVEAGAPPEEELRAADDRLRELHEACEAASEGTAFLKRKQYDERLRALQRQRREDTIAELESRLAELAAAVQPVDASSSGSPLGGGRKGPRIALLADDDREEAIGDAIEDVVDEGAEVRYTGPWPPYTFTPAFGEES